MYYNVYTQQGAHLLIIVICPGILYQCILSFVYFLMKKKEEASGSFCTTLLCVCLCIIPSGFWFIKHRTLPMCVSTGSGSLVRLSLLLKSTVSCLDSVRRRHPPKHTHSHTPYECGEWSFYTRNKKHTQPLCKNQKTHAHKAPSWLQPIEGNVSGSALQGGLNILLIFPRPALKAVSEDVFGASGSTLLFKASAVLICLAFVVVHQNSL